MAEERIVEQRAAVRAAGPVRVEYPDTDGLPMAENDWQADAIVSAKVPLQLHFADWPDVYVSGDLLLYYVEGDAGQSVAPDMLVVFGVPARQRRSYLRWEEGRPPDFVLEVSSPSSRVADRR